MKTLYILACLLFALQSFSFAQGMVYRPRNPSFGGDTFNYNWLLSSAQVQDKTKDPSAVKTSTSTETNELADFTKSLNSQLLNSISRQLYTSQFGEDGIKEGSYKYGDFTVDVSPGSQGLVVKITDGKGGETAITVPYY